MISRFVRPARVPRGWPRRKPLLRRAVRRKFIESKRAGRYAGRQITGAHGASSVRGLIALRRLTAFLETTRIDPGPRPHFILPAACNGSSAQVSLCPVSGEFVVTPPFAG